MAAVDLKSVEVDVPVPSPGQLPIELLVMIFPDPAIIHGITPASHNPRRQKWLAIKALEPDSSFVTLRVNPDETIATLRSLSQVSRTFRAIALPRLWSVCQVRTMKELGALRETLRINPSIAKLIRSFSWVWLMGGDYQKMGSYDEKEGSLLAMAFRNRCKMWHDLKEENAQKVDTDVGGRARSTAWFNLDDPNGDFMTFEAPGWQAEDGEENEEFEAQWEAEDYDLFKFSYSSNSAVGGNGPDGYGEDKRIKCAAEFLDCLAEIIAQLSYLETFAWGSPVSTMPVPVFELLKKLTTLKSLQVVLCTARVTCAARENEHVVPYWELARGLEHLSIQPRWSIFPTDPMYMMEPGKQDEKELVSFELPSEAPVTHQARCELDVAIAYRTIIAAARGGKLKRLHCSFINYEFEKVFAVPSLLPYWVALDELAVQSSSYGGAAASLRPLLAHASLCLKLTNNERLLTAQEVQGLYAHFKNGNEVPCYRPTPWNRKEPQAVELYLPWLRDDVLLAHEVAEAWNKVVKAGGEDLVRCPCETCKDKLSGNK